MERGPAIFDASIHPLFLPEQDLRDLAFFGVGGAVAVVGDEIEGQEPEDLLAAFARLVREEPLRLRRAGITPFVALGIHPRRIPAHGLERVIAELPALFDEARVVAVGPVGLEEGGPLEEEAFLRQLELAQSLGTRVIVRTPSREKARHTRRLLGLLRESGIEPARVLVGQVNAQTVRLVRACGYAASISVSPLRIRAEDAVALVRQLGSSDLVLASEVGAGPGDLLALPRTAWLLGQAGLSPEIVRRVARENALAFFGIDPAAAFA
ncbi:TatD family hydrolase [Vulgatibacter sp.]|uniref:TatD family hydrolase n=1 Tax=Vulgatibacter sp. TaxID=1971226 RepID=UPI0035670DB6